MSFSRELNEQTIAKLDASNMRVVIAEMPEHLLDAISRADVGLATFKRASSYSNIVLGGLGGSAIGGDLVRSYLGNDCAVSFEIVRGYELPKSATKDSLVIISSYSGNTEESLSLFEQAVDRGIQPVCITAGGKLLSEAERLGLTRIALPQGFQPRAALGYSFVSVMLTLEQAGLVKDVREHIRAASAHAEELSASYQALPRNKAFDIAQQLVHHVPVIYSASDVLGTINVRWRGQLQENAKHFAFGSVLPEMNHNEINGWEHPRDLVQNFAVVMLRSPEDEHPRVQKRFEVLEEILADKGIKIINAHAQGNDRLSRMFSLITLGDWVSFYLAMLTDVDPTPIPAIDKLKNALS